VRGFEVEVNWGELGEGVEGEIVCGSERADSDQRDHHNYDRKRKAGEDGEGNLPFLGPPFLLWLLFFHRFLLFRLLAFVDPAGFQLLEFALAVDLDLRVRMPLAELKSV